VPDPAVDAEVARRFSRGESFAVIGAVFGHRKTWAFYGVERMGLERQVRCRRADTFVIGERDRAQAYVAGGCCRASI
jgi:hypothetical protein